MFTVPLSVSTSSKVVKVKLGEKYIISCNATGDSVTIASPWLHDGKPFTSDKGAGVTVNNVRLNDTIGVMSNITFAKVTEEQLGNYTCQAGDKIANVTLVKAGKCTVYVNGLTVHNRYSLHVCTLYYSACCIYRVVLCSPDRVSLAFVIFHYDIISLGEESGQQPTPFCIECEAN